MLKGGALFWAVIHPSDQEAAKPQWLLTERGQGGNRQEFLKKIKLKTRGFESYGHGYNLKVSNSKIKA